MSKSKKQLNARLRSITAKLPERRNVPVFRARDPHRRARLLKQQQAREKRLGVR